MKIDRLDLKAYGPFTDHSLDLSTPGVHLIIGPNEAGKSTTLNAIEDALYGIHTRTTAGFLHGMQSLIIGLHLRQSNDAMLQFKRLKKNKGSLVRSDGSELSQTELDRFLGGIGRAEFSALYGIGHKDLAAGSKDLLAGKGDLGQAIFGASVGSVSLHSALKKLEERIGGLYRQTGKNVRLNAAITKYEESREDAKTHSLAPLEYGEALSRISDLEGAIQQRLASQRVLSEERLECQQLLEALERIRLRQKSIDRIEELRPTTDLLRIGIGEEFAEVRSALVTHRESVRRSNSEIESIEAAIDAVSTDPGVLEHWGEIGRLREGREQYKSQREGFPIAAEKVESTRRAVSALLARLGADPNIEAAQTVSVPRIAEARVLELADMEGELRVAFEKSRSSLMDATAKLQSQQRTLSEIAVLPDHRQLDSSLRGCRSGDDLTARRNAVTQELRSTQTKTTELAVDLGLGELSSSELLKLSVPTLATIEKFRDRLNVK
ncbi:MAG TPA: AAA family ATPase, partial [Microthrixaceae bacterium]|nr:AAA family ATPase [Microthrixaceae bacterium]